MAECPNCCLCCRAADELAREVERLKDRTVGGHLADLTREVQAKDEEIATLRKTNQNQLDALDIVRDEIDKLREQIPHPGDGSCDRCGTIPSVDIPTALCPNCIATEDDVAKLRAVQGELVEAAGMASTLLEEIQLFNVAPSSNSIDILRATIAAAIARAEGGA